MKKIMSGHFGVFVTGGGLFLNIFFVRLFYKDTFASSFSITICIILIIYMCKMDFE